ncbi:MAG: ABC transporter permease [Acidimicrobiales bacterium]
MRHVLHAEWTKLRTLPTAACLLVATVVATIGLSAAVASAQNPTNTGTSLDATKTSLIGVDVGQAVVAVLAVLLMSSEYGCGLIGVTLVATPRRYLVLLSKALFAAVLSLAAGAFAVLGSVLIGGSILNTKGLTAAHGYEITSLANATNLRAAGGTVLYMALIALLSLGVATVVREPVPAIGVVLGLLYVFPLLGAIVTDPTWSRRFQQVGPMSAGLAIEATRNLKGLPLSPWTGLGVLAAWALGVLVLGGLLFGYRDV